MGPKDECEVVEDMTVDERDFMLDAYNYDLPEEFIAQKPAEPRDTCKLMVVDRKRDRIIHDVFFNLPNYLSPGDLLVLNNTKVLHARLFVRKPTGARVELLFVKSVGEGDKWLALARPSKKLRPGLELIHEASGHRFLLEERRGKEWLVSVGMNTHDFLGFLDRWGIVPLPPYIRHAEGVKPEQYQTVYAQIPGSAAAPTAGLHFTDRVFDALKKRGVSWVYVTLHVGLGTFEPVRVNDIRHHKMHSEYIEVSPEVAEQINRVKSSGGRIVAVGTTSVRTLETVATDKGFVRPFRGETNLFIYPGYRFKVVDGLITNFHLPKSSLLMLVSAFWSREKLLRAYEIAKSEGYRFFSFGDAMLIL